MKRGDPFYDPSQGSSAHICISCVSSMKLCVFETPAIRFTTLINGATLKRLPLGIIIRFKLDSVLHKKKFISTTLYKQHRIMKNDFSIDGSTSWVVTRV